MKHSNLISGHPVPQINLDSALQASYEYSLVIRTEAARSPAPCAENGALGAEEQAADPSTYPWIQVLVPRIISWSVGKREQAFGRGHICVGYRFTNSCLAHKHLCPSAGVCRWAKRTANRVYMHEQTCTGVSFQLRNYCMKNALFQLLWIFLSLFLCTFCHMHIFIVWSLKKIIY